MATKQRLCMGCMNPLTVEQDKCVLCGYPVRGNNPPQFLPVGTVLASRYMVGRVLSAAGDAAVYIGFDGQMRERVHIREFFPDTLCRRDASHALAVTEGNDALFDEFLAKFRQFTDRRIAADEDMPALPAVVQVLEENGTLYTVEEITEGVSLETYLAQNEDRLSWDEARPLFMGLISTLSAMHRHGLLHLGISPTNLIVGRDGKLHLRGVALPEVRHVGTKLKPHLISGFSAPEQYVSGTPCSVATDVYGFAATLFRTLSGTTLPDSVTRVKGKSDIYMPAQTAETIPDHVLETLVAALALDPAQRLDDMETVRDCLASASEAVTALRAEEENEEEQTARSDQDDGAANRRSIWLIVSGVAVVLFLIGTAVVLSLFSNELFGDGGVFSGGDKPNLEKRTNAQGNTVVTYAVDQLIGENYFDIRDDHLTGYMKLNLLYMEYSDQPRGTILKQEPAAGTLMEKESTVDIVISAGSETRVMPNLNGWDELTARMYLEALGLRVETMKVVESLQERGKVDSLEPSPGMLIKEGELVILKISDVEPEPDPEPEYPDDPYGDFEPDDPEI